MTLSRDEVIRLLASTPGVLSGMVGGLDEASIEAPVDGGWSARDVIHHILDVQEIAFMSRIRRIIEEDRPFIRSINPSARIAASPFAAAPVATIIAELARVRAAELGWAASLTDAQLEREGMHDEAGIITAGNILHYWPVHDLLHLRQLTKVIQAGRPLTTYSLTPAGRKSFTAYINLLEKIVQQTKPK